jgi:hypothetical protein
MQRFSSYRRDSGHCWCTLKPRQIEPAPRHEFETQVAIDQPRQQTAGLIARGSSLKSAQGLFCGEERTPADGAEVSKMDIRLPEGANSFQDFRAAVGLCQKHAPGWHRVRLGGPLSGRNDDIDRRPPISDGGSEFQTIHRVTQLDVGENRPNIVGVSKTLIASSAFAASRTRSLAVPMWR